MGSKWTWFCWPCSWIIDATCIGRLVWWSFVILNFYTSQSVCICIDKKQKTPAFFYWRVSRTACLLLSSVLSMCILCLYFVLKNKKKNPLLLSMLALSPLFFFSLGHMKQVILFLYLFFFCKPFCFVLFKNGFIKGLL